MILSKVASNRTDMAHIQRLLVLLFFTGLTSSQELCQLCSDKTRGCYGDGIHNTLAQQVPGNDGELIYTVIVSTFAEKSSTSCSIGINSPKGKEIVVKVGKDSRNEDLLEEEGGFYWKIFRHKLFPNRVYVRLISSQRTESSNRISQGEYFFRFAENEKVPFFLYHPEETSLDDPVETIQELVRIDPEDRLRECFRFKNVTGKQLEFSCHTVYDGQLVPTCTVDHVQEDYVDVSFGKQSAADKNAIVGRPMMDHVVKCWLRRGTHPVAFNLSFKAPLPMTKDVLAPFCKMENCTDVDMKKFC